MASDNRVIAIPACAGMAHEMLDWRQEANYSYTNALTASQWAWEFLRRNPLYQSEYRQFIATWKALEAAYGVPPERDFQSWKADPRAYLIVGEDAGAEGCRVDEDKVLIECALGAKWGFYQFPRDPALSAPELDATPVWRELARTARPVSAADGDYLGGNPHHVALGFDLDLPLKEQLEQARLYLGRAYAGARRRDDFRPRTIAYYRERWQLCLRVLDAEAAGAAVADDMPVLSEATLPVTAELVTEARRLRDGGYREILLLPEGA